ncbi:IQ domain-containing protein IQM6 [Argentina anserina]|uniref:IQ domain-containing protein IQM6 n=1 Tax=Argentina anserina TaxID=57926 RepID=UPI0021761D83|nr:IQ domain-containing protein IQM6 [Potentilla anserina]
MVLEKMIYNESHSINAKEVGYQIVNGTPLRHQAATPKDMENKLSAIATSDSKDRLEISHQTGYSSSEKGTTHRYQAALKLQKVYKSFRTRRQLADCAILVEQRWWKVLDFAELKRSSISFFDIKKPETAVSRWARAKKRAAKVGKGLSKDKKARKLALQHWLEAIDPRHRYGHNLHFYYAKWLHCESKQPFFYWLDIGEGRELTLEACPRSKLQTQCIKYLGPVERKAYEVLLEDGKLMYKESGVVLDTTKGPKETKWIFVLSVSKDLYVGQKSKGTFQHSSFLAGGATLSAGRLVVENGILKSVWPHSGHYLPTEENFEEFMLFLLENNVDLTNVKTVGEDEEGGALSKKSNTGFRNSPRKPNSSKDTITNDEGTVEESTDSRDESSHCADNPHLLSRLPEKFCSKIAKLNIPGKEDVFEDKDQNPITCREYFPDSDSDSDADEDGYETAEESKLREEDFMVSKMNLFDEDPYDEEEEKPISKEKIMQRISSHKGMNSYQLGQHLSTKWSTGAGPRIGCMRDYPSELQFRVLQQACLSPRPVGRTPRNACPSPLTRESKKPVQE